MKLMRSIADISHYHHYFFFQTNVLLSIENAKFGPILAIYDFFCVLMHFWCTFLVYQNGQILGMGGDKQSYVALKVTHSSWKA